MMFPLRALHLSFWLFFAWVILRVWEMNFEVSPLPAILLPIFVFCVLFALAFGVGYRLQRRHALDRLHLLWSCGLLVVGGFFWELGLTIYLSGWGAWASIFTLRFLVGVLVQATAILAAGYWLRQGTIRVE